MLSFITHRYPYTIHTDDKKILTMSTAVKCGSKYSQLPHFSPKITGQLAWREITQFTSWSVVVPEHNTDLYREKEV